MPQKRRSTFYIDWLYLCTYVDLGESFETNVVDDIPAAQKYCAKTLIHVYKTMKNTNYSRFLDNSLYISVPVVSYGPLPTDGHCQKSASIKLTLLQHDSHRKLLCTLVNHSIHRRRCQLVTVPVHIVPRRITSSTANSWAASAPDWPVSRQQHECECVLQGGGDCCMEEPTGETKTRFAVRIRGKSGPALGGTEYRLKPSACRLIVRAKLWNLQFRYLVSRAPMRRRSIVVV